MEITGKIIAVCPLRSGQSKSGNAWQSQEYVLETTETYPKRCCFELFGDKIQKFAIKEGEVLTVQFDIDAREYNGRWFNSVKAWNVNRQQAQQPANAYPTNQPLYAPPYTGPMQPAQPQQGSVPQSQQSASSPAATQQSDDLPF